MSVECNRNVCEMSPKHLQIEGEHLRTNPIDHLKRKTESCTSLPATCLAAPKLGHLHGFDFRCDGWIFRV
eukprot:6468833-Amphidinium_carterae.1